MVAEFGDNLSVVVVGDSRRIQRQSPFLATVADYSRQCGQGITRLVWLRHCSIEPAGLP